MPRVGPLCARHAGGGVSADMPMVMYPLEAVMGVGVGVLSEWPEHPLELAVVAVSDADEVIGEEEA